MMNLSFIFVFLVCRISILVLYQLVDIQTNRINSNDISPFERSKLEKKVHISKIFINILNYGSAIYLVAMCILQFLTVFYG